jgi:hypothetical protein
MGPGQILTRDGDAREWSQVVVEEHAVGDAGRDLEPSLARMAPTTWSHDAPMSSHRVTPN